jgi:hypothetical protein
MEAYSGDMSGPLYPAARLHAARIERHFARHLADAGPASAAAGPDGTIEVLVDAGFWASLRREEGYPPAISLAFLPPDRAVALGGRRTRIAGKAGGSCGT